MKTPIKKKALGSIILEPNAFLFLLIVKIDS
jgi:hypothetical protein